MCLLIYASPGSTPSKKALRIAGENNPDGFGFAFALGRKIVRHRSMDLEDTIALFHEMRTEHPKAHAMFHLRITTHGATNIDNCHPFMVDDGIVLGHNGMLPIPEADGKSDTRQFAEEWLPELGVKNVLDDPTEFAELEKFTRGSKLCILSVDKRLDKPVYLVNEKDGHWKDGVWYSNDSYQKSWWSFHSWQATAVRTTATPKEIAWDDDINVWVDYDNGDVYEWDEKKGWVLTGNDFSDYQRYSYCTVCDANLGSAHADAYNKQYCWDCGTCIACEQSHEKCFCHNYMKTK